MIRVRSRSSRRTLPTNVRRSRWLAAPAYADRSTKELIALAKNNLQPRLLTAGFGGRIALTDGMIHEQDIRRPLGLPRHIPPQRLTTVLDFVKTAPTISALNASAGSG
jgi:hypothetical protein